MAKRAASKKSRSRKGTRSSNGTITYKDAGVDIDAGARWVGAIESAMRSTYGPRVCGDRHGGFAGLFRLDYDEQLFRRNYRRPLLVGCTDGVGTKVLIAIKMKRLDTIGVDLVAMNVNDLLTAGARPLSFLDYISTGNLSSIDAEGIVWFSERRGGKIGRFDPRTETFQEFQLPGPEPSPYALGIDRNGMIWYASHEQDTLGRLNPRTGAITEYPFPHSEISIREFFLDSKGRMWYGSTANDLVGYFIPPSD